MSHTSMYSLLVDGRKGVGNLGSSGAGCDRRAFGLIIITLKEQQGLANMASADHELSEGKMSLYALIYWHRPRRSGAGFQIESIKGIGDLERYSASQRSSINSLLFSLYVLATRIAP